MWCSRLVLEDIRSYKRSTVNFSKGINLIVGPNNSGKSTVLKSLLRFQTKDWNESGYLRNGCTTGLISATFEDSNNPLFGVKKDSSIIELPNKSRHEVLANVYSEGQVRFAVRSDNEEKEFGIFSDSEPDNVFYPFFSKRNTPYSRNISEDSIYRITYDLSNLASRIEKLVNPSHPQHDNFTSACQDILNFKVGIISRKEEKFVGIYTSDSQSIPLYTMGEGVANILGILSILLTENKKIFLIEELENDLHPKALKQLLELILTKSSENQFILTTHSNIILKCLGSAEDCKIFRTSWTPFDSDINISRIPTSQIEEVENETESRIKLLDYLGYDLLDFDIWRACLVLEESSAERIIRDFLIPNFVPELVGKLLTIAANGVDDISPKFTDLHRLFVYVHKQPLYNKRAWVIVDGDEAGITAIKSLREKFTSWEEGHFISFGESDFEYYYPEEFQQRVKNVLKISNKKEKRKQKKELLNDVLNWIRINNEEAKKQFQESAMEVIEILKLISKKITR